MNSKYEYKYLVKVPSWWPQTRVDSYNEYLSKFFEGWANFIVLPNDVSVEVLASKN